MDKLLKIINQNAQKTGNLCGITAVVLSKKANLSYGQTKRHLNDLFLQKKINIREGINLKLVFAL